MIISNRILSVPEMLIEETTQGVFLRPISSPGGAEPAAGTLQALKFESFGFGNNPLNVDFITCSGKQVYLPPLMRFSLDKRDPYALTTPITFTNYNPATQTRVATIAGFNITQYITPQYLVGDLIYVMTIQKGGLGGGFLIDMNVDARTFAGP